MPGVQKMADLPMDRTMPGKPGEITELKLVQYILCDRVVFNTMSLRTLPLTGW